MRCWLFELTFSTPSTRREAELKKLEEDAARRMEELIQKKVEERLNSEETKLEIQRRIEEGCKKLFDDVDLQLEKEKEAALTAARQKEVSVFFPILFATF